MDERIDLTENRIFREKPKLVNARGFNLKSKDNTVNQWSISFRDRILRTGELVVTVLNNMATLSDRDWEVINNYNDLLHLTTNKKIYINIYGKICIARDCESIQQGYCPRCGCKTMIDYDVCSRCNKTYDLRSVL